MASVLLPRNCSAVIRQWISIVYLATCGYRAVLILYSCYQGSHQPLICCPSKNVGQSFARDHAGAEEHSAAFHAALFSHFSVRNPPDHAADHNGYRELQREIKIDRHGQDRKQKTEQNGSSLRSACSSIRTAWRKRPTRTMSCSGTTACSMR